MADDLDSPYIKNVKDALQTGLLEMLEEKLLSDVSIDVGDTSFKCHKLVLSAVSPYFKAMFCSEFKEKHQPVITIQDINPCTFENVIQFVYGKGNVLSESNCEDLLRAANTLQIGCLQKSCEEFILAHISPENCFGVWMLACSLSCQSLASLAKKYICHNFDKACVNEEFLRLNNDQLNELIKDEKLETKSEDIICDAVLRWITNDYQNKKPYVLEILRNVRLPLTSPEYLLEMTEKFGYIYTENQASGFIAEAARYHLLPGQRHAITSSRTQHRESSPYVNVAVAIGSDGSVLASKLLPGSDIENNWQSLESLPFKPGHFFAVCSFLDEIYVSGGRALNENHFARYSCEQNKWIFCEPFPTARFRHGMVVVGKSIYLIGGSSEKDNYLTSIDEYSVSSETYQRVGDLCVAVRSMSCTSGNKQIYIFGGKTPTAEKTTTIQCFDTRSGQCTLIGNLPQPIHLSTPVNIGNAIYICSNSNDGTIMQVNPQEDFSIEVLLKVDPIEFDGILSFQHMDYLYIFDRLGNRNTDRSMMVRKINLLTGVEILNSISSPDCQDKHILIVKSIMPRRFLGQELNI